MPAPFTSTSNAIANAKAARETAATEYAAAEEEWRKIEADYAELIGVAQIKQTFGDMVRTYGPTVAKWIGGPAAAAAVTGLVADPGAFSGLGGVFGKLLGVLGLG